MQVIHVQTNVNTVFGLLNDAGDVVEQFPVQLTLNQLTPEFFDAAIKQLLDTKVKLSAEKVPVVPVESN